MEKTPKLLILLQNANEISQLLESGSSSVEVQRFLESKGISISNKHLRINLKKVFPQYVVNGRWDPMRKRCESELKKYKQSQCDQEPLPSPASETKVEKPENDKEVMASYADANINEQVIEDTGNQGTGSKVVLATLSSGVTIDSDIKGHIKGDHYRLISEVYPQLPNSDNAIRSLLSQSVFGRDYLRNKHEKLNTEREKESRDGPDISS